MTLKEIADAAQVSVSTACRALNGHPAINAQTVARVRQLAEELAYRPRRSHRRASVTRGLAGARIGVVSLGVHRSLLELPVIAAAIGGAEAELSAAGATVQLIQAPDPDRAPAGLDEQRLDGAVLVGAMEGDAVARSAAMRRLAELPCVWLVGRPAGCAGDAVVSDDYATGALAAEYLFARGHRELAFVNPKPGHLLFMRREDGFVARARRLGARVRSYCRAPTAPWALPLHPPETVDAVQGLVDELVKDRPRPTAIFAAADSVAVLVYRAMAVRGLRVGEDVSVISANNDAALVQGLHPRLTTFDVHAEEIGRLGAGQLAVRMSSEAAARRDVEVMLAPTLVEGRSVTGPAAARSVARTSSKRVR